jgi:hypothetical protein
MTSSEKGLNQLDVLASILEKQFKPIVRQANLLSEGKNPDIWQTPNDSPTSSGAPLSCALEACVLPTRLTLIENK